jgi:hypothetical protein
MLSGFYPFRLAFTLMVIAFVIAAYVVAGVCEALWYNAFGRRYLVGSAIGQTLREIVSTIARFFGR